MVLLLFGFVFFFLIYVFTLGALFYNGKKYWGIFALLAMPVFAVVLYIGFFFLLFSIPPRYSESDAREDLKEIGFDLKDDFTVADTDYNSSFLDESRYSKIVISPADKAYMIQSIKNAPNYTFGESIVSDSINNADVFSKEDKDTIFERIYTARIGTCTIRDVVIFSHSDTIRFSIDKP